MDSTRKLWLLILFGACVLVLQYHVSTTWTAANMGGPSYASGNAEELAQAVVSRLQLDDSVANAVGKKYLREVALQIGRDMFSAKGCDLSFSAASWPEPTLYLITPTYRRPEQIAELTRMAQTLMHVKNLVWLVIEDAETTTHLVTKFLERTGINFHHLLGPMPKKYKTTKVKPRGVSNRNRGLEWIRANATRGVLYFADDDNTYDISLFQEIRTTKKVSMFPVGLCTKLGVSSPVVKNGTLVGFYDGWPAGRKFPVDMAGFAINIEFLSQRPNASMPYRPGYEEDGFLKSLAPFEPNEVELKADNCTKGLKIKDENESRRKTFSATGRVNKHSMDVNFPLVFANNVIKTVQRSLSDFGIAKDQRKSWLHSKRLPEVLRVFVPILAAVVLYQYLKYLLILNASQYEDFVKKRKLYLRKLSKQLRLLAKKYENFYFCYMPMSHGTTLPPTYSVFMAIKEILNANRPATRTMRTSVLMDLLRGDFHDPFSEGVMRLDHRDLFDPSPNEIDPLSEYNLDIMKCTRELIIQGIKDFDVMTTVFRVMETVTEELD